VLLVCRDEDLQSRFAELKARLAASQLRRAAAASSDNQAQARVEEFTLKSTARELADVQRRIDELTIKAPIDGYLVAPDIDQMPGRYFQVGEEICIVQETDQLRVRGTVSQEDRELLKERGQKIRAFDPLS